VESVYGEGATFLCFLPVPSQEALSNTRKQTVVLTPSEPALATTSVLVVDDDERVLRSYARLLGSRHRLMVAYDGREAIEMLQSGSTPDVLVIELDLPGEDGRDLVAWLEADRPDLARRTVLATSGGSGSSYDDFLRTYRGLVVHKPVRGAELLAAIAAITTAGDRDGVSSSAR